MEYSAHILIVDDNAAVCDVIRLLLEDNGFRVSVAGGGTEMRRIIAGQSPIDLVILDATLAGERGASLASHARELAIPVIMMTGDPESRHSVETSGLPFLFKPFHMADLLKLVSETLGLVD
jgi:two-component system, OmpR family, response regulator